MHFPITYFEGNLVINRQREAWAVYRVQPWHYEHIGAEARLGLLWRLSRLFWELEDTNGQLLMVPRLFQTADHLNRLAGELSGPLGEIAAAYCRQASGQLAGTRDGIGYEYYLALRLPQVGPLPISLSDYLKSLWQEPRRLLDELSGLRPPRLLEYELDGYMSREEALMARLNRVCKATRVNEQTIANLIRRGFYRGIGEAPERTGWTPESMAYPGRDGSIELQPERSEITTLTEGEMDLRNPRQIKLTQVTAAGDASGLTSFAFVSDLPDEMLFPGCEWLYGLQDLAFPVEVCLRWSSINKDEAVAMVRKKRLEIQDQDQHNRGAGEEVPISLLNAQEQVALLEQDLKERRFPTILSSISLAISAPEQRDLWERVQQVRSHLNTFQIGMEVPAGDQLAAFMDFIPGSMHQVHDYVHRLPPEVLAGSMFLGTQALGDQQGPYIGCTSMLRRPVYLDPALAPKLNRSASIAFLGSLGSGKSFAANLLSYLAVMFSGAQALILDPKGERSNWAQDLPELSGFLRVITLGPGSADNGRLDPFILGRGLDEDGWRETGNLAVSLLAFLGNIPTGDPRFLALMSAVEEVAKRPSPSLGQVVDQLAEMGQGERQVLELAQFYKVLSRRAYANLIFGKGDEQGLELEHKMNILQLQHLVMPPVGKPRGEYSLEELLSVALMHAVTSFATQFTRRNRETFKIVLLDEAWALMASSQGRSLVTHLLRTGRALNNAVYLVSQSVSDLLDETIRNNLGAKFIFRSFDHGEIEKQLAFLNLEPDAENLGILRQLDTGQVLFQDLEGRTGVVTMDPVFPHLVRAFDTRPNSRRKEALA